MSPLPRRPRLPGDRGGGRSTRFRTILGIPIPLILVALALSALIGFQLAAALETSTESRARTVSTAAEGTSGAGKNESGLPVITETTLGTEVQRLVDTGAIQPMTGFDAARCLKDQGISDSVLIMEEVAWDSEEIHSWLLVHGPEDRETLRATGGSVSAIVVRPTCGTEDSDPDDDRLWSGSVMISSV